VPVRSTLTGCCVGLVALMMALTVGTSLDHLLRTPRLYGWSYDVALESDFGTPAQRAAIERLPGVAAVSFGGQGAPLVIDRVATEGMAFRAEDTATGPLILEGRRPNALNEIAVGRKTLGELHKRIGDTAKVAVQGTTGFATMRIVGTTVLPLNGDQATLGQGIFMTYESVHALVPEAAIDTAFIRIAPGRRAEVLHALQGRGFVDLPQQPAAVVDFGHVRAMPLILASVLALLAAGTIAHLLATSVRRRRRDLAILKTLGFRRAQISGSIAWQSGTVAVVSLAISVPLGIALGRWMWNLFARYGGFFPEPVGDAKGALVVAAAALVVSQLVAVIPGLNAGRTRPAPVLRAE